MIFSSTFRRNTLLEVCGLFILALIRGVVPSTSMIKFELTSNSKNLELNKYLRLRQVMKKLTQDYQPHKAATFSQEEIEQILKSLGFVQLTIVVYSH